MAEAENTLHDLGMLTEDPRVGVLLLLAFRHGQDPVHLSAVTGYPLEFVETIAGRMKRNQLWIDGKFAFQHWDDKGPDGVALFNIEFVLYELIAEGEIVKIPSKDD